MPDYRASINHMLVHLFNDILRIEETALRDSGISELSMREIHLLQAVMEAGDQNTMTSVAARLHVTVGSLTVAVNTLVRKGYLTRSRSAEDKRRIHLLLTSKADAVNRLHEEFHRQMTDAVMQAIPPEQLDLLCTTLDNVTHYFQEQERKRNT